MRISSNVLLNIRFLAEFSARYPVKKYFGSNLGNICFSTIISPILNYIIRRKVRVNFVRSNLDPGCFSRVESRSFFFS